MLGVLAIGILLPSLGVAAPPPESTHAISLPDGWIKAESNGASIFRPNDVPPGKMYFIMIFPEEPLAGKSLTQWFNIRIDTILAKSGTLVRRGKIEQKTPKILTCTSAFKPTADEQLVGFFTAAASRPGHARLLMMTTASDPALRERYKIASRAILHDFRAAAITEAKESGGTTPTAAAGNTSKDGHPVPSGEKETERKKDGSPTSGG